MSRPLPDVRVGQIWRDCDLRMLGRQRRVLRIEGDKAVMGAIGGSDYRASKVSIRRMYKHSTGFELVKDVP